MMKTDSDNGLFALSARWLLPIAGPPLSAAALVIDGQRIKAVDDRQSLSRHYPGLPVRDYGEAIIAPGLINLHTHLDYTALRHFDTQAGFFPWIRGLVARAFPWTSDQWRASALTGAREVALSGTTCVADSSYSGAAAWALSRLGLRAVVGLELFGIASDQAGRVWSEWLGKLESLQSQADSELYQALASGLIKLTVAPHAPYTVCPDLWELANCWAENQSLPVLAHISESESECRWLAGTDQQVEEFLRDMLPGGLPDNGLSWQGNGLTPVAHLDRYNLLRPNTLAAHGVHLLASDIALIAERQVKLAHCPRSNARLRNGVAPLRALLDQAVEIGFGTDSAASTDDLNVLSEARFAWNLQRALIPDFAYDSQEAVYRLTLGAAKILGLGESIGSLEPGKLADVAVFSIKPDAPFAADRPFDLLLYGQAELRDLFVNGVELIRDGDVKMAP